MYDEYLLKELILSSQREDKESSLILINKFTPLLLKYSVRLRYEDSFNDLLVYFIELIKKMNFSILKSSKDKYIISYINTCVKRQYINLLRDKIKYNNSYICFSDLSDKQRYWIESKSKKMQDYNNLLKLDLKNILSKKEYEIIYYLYFMGYNVYEISVIKNVSRQSINQTKLRAINKLKKIYK